jgi:hypothetical protein
MAEVVVEIPEGYEQEVRRLAKGIKFEELVFKSFKHCVEVEIKKKLLQEIASTSKLTEEQALKLGEEVKEGIAKRHGVL